MNGLDYMDDTGLCGCVGLCTVLLCSVSLLIWMGSPTWVYELLYGTLLVLGYVVYYYLLCMLLVLWVLIFLIACSCGSCLLLLLVLMVLS